MIILIWVILLVVLLILTSMTQNLVFFGILVLSTGLLCLYLKNKGMALAPRAVSIAGLYAIIWGIVTIVAAIIKADAEKWIFVEGLAGVFLGLGIYQGVVKAVICRKKVTAIYSGARPHTSQKGGTYYEPFFSYRYQDCQYQGATGEIFRRRKLTKRFREGKPCTIYLNPKNPKIICTKRYPQKYAILMICTGVMVASMPFWVK